MKKLITLLLVLTGMVQMASAEEDTYTVAGNNETLFGTSSWDPSNTDNDMELVDGMYKWEMIGASLSVGNVEFKVVKNHSFDEAWPVQNYVLNIPWTGGYHVTITFDPSEKEVYAVAVTKVEIAGDFTSWATDQLVLDKQGTTHTYTGVLDLREVNTDQNMKLINNSTWLNYSEMTVDAPDGWTEQSDAQYQNIRLKHSSTDYLTYDLTAIWNNGWTLKIEGKEECPATSYTLMGAFYDGEEHASILNSIWDATYTANDMVKGEGNIYTKTYSNVDLTPGNFQFKVAKNYKYVHTYPAANYQLDIDAAGMYDIEVTFNADSKVVSATATPVADAYTVVGDEELTGYNWAVEAANHMTLNKTDGVYEWTAENIIVSTTAQPEFKVWKKDDTWYPSGDNWKITLDYVGNIPGKYTIKITFNALNNGIGVTATKTHEAVTISNEKGWATTVTNSALDFSAQTFKAYTATLDGTTVTLAEASDVPAETGLVLKGAPDTYYVPVIESSSKGKGSLSGSSTESYTVGSEAYDCFGLTIKNDMAQFVKINDEVVISAKKAFLKTAQNLARELTVVFEGETTGIETVNAEQATLKGEMYNLAGQKVNKSFKGLVINNGKKAIMK